MAVEIHPIPLYGVWDIGYALDVHTIKSIPIGEDAYGHLHLTIRVLKLVNYFINLSITESMKI